MDSSRTQEEILADIKAIQALQQQLRQQTTVTLNIGGAQFVTTKTTLQKEKDSLLVSIIKDPKDYQNSDGTIFIDRDPLHFRLILNFLRDGEIVIPKKPESKEELLKEARYYKLDRLIRILETESLQESIISTSRIDTSPPSQPNILENKESPASEKTFVRGEGSTNEPLINPTFCYMCKHPTSNQVISLSLVTILRRGLSVMHARTSISKGEG